MNSASSSCAMHVLFTVIIFGFYQITSHYIVLYEWVHNSSWTVLTSTSNALKIFLPNDELQVPIHSSFCYFVCLYECKDTSMNSIANIKSTRLLLPYLNSKVENRLTALYKHLIWFVSPSKAEIVEKTKWEFSDHIELPEMTLVAWILLNWNKQNCFVNVFEALIACKHWKVESRLLSLQKQKRRLLSNSQHLNKVNTLVNSLLKW